MLRILMGTLSEDVSLCMTPCLAAAQCCVKGRGLWWIYFPAQNGREHQCEGAENTYIHWRHLITYIGKYDKKNMNWKQVHNTCSLIGTQGLSFFVGDKQNRLLPNSSYWFLHSL